MSKPYRYPEKLLIRLIREVKDYKDLLRLNLLYSELQEAGDITLNYRIGAAFKLKEFTLKNKPKP